jgi:hypothetical protein
VWLPNAPWVDEYIESMVGFGAGGLHDDDTDCTSQVMKRWATAARPFLGRDQRESIANVQLGVAVGAATRWGRRDVGATYYLGIVPGWANGGSPAVAAIVDARGGLVSMLECTAGGVDGFVSSLTLETDHWQRIGGGRYAETEGRPYRETVIALTRANVRVSGSWDKLVGDKKAGWTGDRRETADLWGGFLSCIGEGRVAVSDGRTLAQLETVVEDAGVPRMASGEAIGGRVLALLLALQAMRADVRSVDMLGLAPSPINFRAKEPENAVDLWAMGVQRGRY